jgi:hypothetical protein
MNRAPETHLTATNCGSTCNPLLTKSLVPFTESRAFGNLRALPYTGKVCPGRCAEINRLSANNLRSE